MGLLTGKGPPAWHSAQKRVKAVACELVDFCQSRGVDLSQVAMQFALSYGRAATTLVGMSRVRHVQRNLAVLNAPVDRQVIDEVLQLCRPVANICWQEGLSENHDPHSVPQEMGLVAEPRQPPARALRSRARHHCHGLRPHQMQIATHPRRLRRLVAAVFDPGRFDEVLAQVGNMLQE